MRLPFRSYKAIAKGPHRRGVSSREYSQSEWSQRLQRPVQSYISTSDDPILNLSIEHDMLQNAAPDSVILFLYINKPSIILGRNQNPWLEVNLALLKDRRGEMPSGFGAVDLVRRRSGGGTVFHDTGNVNWTVISPSAAFTRDKHAEMLVRALRSRGVHRSRVNERHDIVLDQGPLLSGVGTPDEHITAYRHADGSGPPSLKISGSAYKLTRGRALHHGTCLLASPNLGIIPRFLRSPAKPYITARGVESVSSPIGNVMLKHDDFIAATYEAFNAMYGKGVTSSLITLGEDLCANDNVRRGYEELQSPEWTYLQTPQFHLQLPSLSTTGRTLLQLEIRQGVIKEASWTEKSRQVEISSALRSDLSGRKVHEIESWDQALEQTKTCLRPDEGAELVSSLERMLPPNH